MRAGAQTKPVITDTDGQYRIIDVANGTYTLFVWKVGYTPRPYTKTKLNVRGNIVVPVIFLWLEKLTYDYLKKAASGIAKTRAYEPAKVRADWYTSQWVDLRTINLPPSSRAVLAKELTNQDAGAAKLSSEVRNYLSASPEAVEKAEMLFGDAIAGKSDVPGKESLTYMKLPEPVIADVVLWQLKDSGASEEKQKAFVKKFAQKWDKTVALERFMAIEKQ